jgi:hypothetical protein
MILRIACIGAYLKSRGSRKCPLKNPSLEIVAPADDYQHGKLTCLLTSLNSVSCRSLSAINL